MYSTTMFTSTHAKMVWPAAVIVQRGSNMTGTDLCVNEPNCAAAVRP